MSNIVQTRTDQQVDDSFSSDLTQLPDHRNGQSNGHLIAGENDSLLVFLDLGLAAMPQAAFSAGRVIRGSVDGSDWSVLVEGEFLPDGISMSKRLKKIFWTQMGIPGKFNGRVRSCNLDGSDLSTIVGDGQINTPKQLIVYDNGTKDQLYFCDREGMKVYRCDTNGSNLEILIDAGDSPTQMDDHTRHCVGVAVSKKRQEIYWTQKGPSKGFKGRILRAKLESAADPRSRQDVEVVLDGLPEPVDLDVDDEGDCLYWTDRGELPSGNSIGKINISNIVTGEDPISRQKHVQFVARNLHEAIGLALDTKTRRLYATDLGGSIYAFDMDTDSVGQAKMPTIYQKQGLAAFSGIALMR